MFRKDFGKVGEQCMMIILGCNTPWSEPGTRLVGFLQDPPGWAGIPGPPWKLVPPQLLAGLGGAIAKLGASTNEKGQITGPVSASDTPSFPGVASCTCAVITPSLSWRGGESTAGGRGLPIICLDVGEDGGNTTLRPCVT